WSSMVRTSRPRGPRCRSAKTSGLWGVLTACSWLSEGVGTTAVPPRSVIGRGRRPESFAGPPSLAGRGAPACTVGGTLLPDGGTARFPELPHRGGTWGLRDSRGGVCSFGAGPCAVLGRRRGPDSPVAADGGVFGCGVVLWPSLL